MFTLCLQVRSFIDGAYQRTLGLLKEKKELVDSMAQVWAESGLRISVRVGAFSV